MLYITTLHCIEWVFAMFFSHCKQLLGSGVSDVRPEQITDVTSVLFRLSAGVRITKLNSIKTSLFMIEAIKLSWSSSDYGECSVESLNMFDNFVSYTYSQFSLPVSMALLKYAFKDRKLSVRNACSSRNWGIVERSFRGPLLDRVHTEADLRIESQFNRCYSRLRRCVSVSVCLNEYIKAELIRNDAKSILSLDRLVHE
jgi:hypothetical protein